MKRKKDARVAKRIQPTNGNNARKLRLEKAWTQEQLAQASDVSLRKIIDIEAGRGADPTVINLVAQALEVHISALLQGDAGVTPAATWVRLANESCAGDIHAKFAKPPEDAESAQLLLDAVAKILSLQPDVIEFVYARKVTSLLIRAKMRPLYWLFALRSFATGTFDDIELRDWRFASIDRMHFPGATLDWPMHVGPVYTNTPEAPVLSQPEMFSLRAFVKWFAYRNPEKIAVRNHSNRSITVRRQIPVRSVLNN
jgi:transcriptional regulator with XRE-family HTH domain